MTKIHTRFTKTLFALCLLMTSQLLVASTCFEVFPSALSSSTSTGGVTFYSESDVLGTNGDIAMPIALDYTSASNPSCVSQKCGDSGNRSAPLVLPPFQSSNSTIDYAVTSGSSGSLRQGTYNNVTVNYQSNLTFTQNNQVTYINTLNAGGSESSVTFSEGIYWINSFNLGFKTDIKISGSGPVVILVNNADFYYSTTTINSSGTPEQLLIVSYNNIRFGYRAIFNGLVLGNDNVTIETESTFTGAINAKNVILKYQAELTSDPESVRAANFFGYCTGHDVSNLSGLLVVDDEFEAYISTSDSVEGTEIKSGTSWQTQYSLEADLDNNQDYYLHIKARDTGGIAGFIGEFELSGSGHAFANGTTSLTTNTADWGVSTSGWQNYQTPTAYGTMASSLWPTFANIDGNANWIWSSDYNNDNAAYFTTKISALCTADGTHQATGILIDNNGTNTEVNSVTEAWTIYQAWIDEGKPSTGLIEGGTYNVAASGTSDVDRIDFGGSHKQYNGTLPYPGFGSVGSGSLSHFLVHTTGTLNLPAGDYTIFVQSDDGFNLVLDSISGDTVVFNKFGGSQAGDSNELLFEGPTGNASTGGSFTLTQNSTFTLSSIFFERQGGDYMEVGISNSILSSTSATNYEVLKHGALDGDVDFDTCPEEEPEITLLAEYRFDDNSFGSETLNIVDSSGNDHHGSIVSNSEPGEDSPALNTDPGTCGYVDQQYGSIAVNNLPVDTSAGAKTTVTFWMNWDGTDNVMPIGWDYHDVWMINDTIGFNTWQNDVYGMSSVGLENSWNHMAIEFTNGDVASNRIHINGVEQSLSQLYISPANNSRAYVNSSLRIGGVVNSSGYRFYGSLDEVQIHKGSLSTEKINEIMAQTQACPLPAVHHYEIAHDGQGLTCDAETITIKACANADCSSLSDEAVSLELFGNTTSFGTAAFTGSTTISHQYTTAETVSLSLSNISVAADNPVVCSNGGGASCDMVFSDAGFRFLSGTANSSVIPHQTAGVLFSDSLKIQAVQNNNGVCAGLFTSNVNVNLSQENVNPGGTSGLAFTSAGANIAKHSSATTVSLNFDANSIAEIPSPIYNDAGQIRLHANYNTDSVTLSGTSNSFWVRPATLITRAKTATQDINGSSATSSITHPAGDNFEFSVTAMNGATPAVITPNYSPGQMQLKVTRTAPNLSTSVDGTLQYAASGAVTSSSAGNFQNVALTGFSNGVSTYSAANYSEVGIINIEAQDANYGSLVVGASAIDVGRFVPKYLSQTVADNGILMATCNGNISFNAYSGQRSLSNNSVGAISYSSAPVLAITAYNSQGNVTQNYYQDSEGSANDFMKLNTAGINLLTPNTDQSNRGVNAALLTIVANMSTGVLSQNDLTASPSVVSLPKGTVHYQLSNSDNYYYVRSANALVNPFTTNIGIVTNSVVDSDGIAATSTAVAEPLGVEMRFGRLVLENSFGSETSNLTQSMAVEHYNNGEFRLSNDYSCYVSDASRISLTNISMSPSLTSILGGTSNFSDGISTGIQYQSPGAGNQGQMGVIYNAHDWLEYDWDNDGNHDNDPGAIVSFGLYKNDERLLHWRESF